MADFERFLGIPMRRKKDDSAERMIPATYVLVRRAPAIGHAAAHAAAAAAMLPAAARSRSIELDEGINFTGPTRAIHEAVPCKSKPDKARSATSNPLGRHRHATNHNYSAGSTRNNFAVRCSTAIRVIFCFRLLQLHYMQCQEPHQIRSK